MPPGLGTPVQTVPMSWGDELRDPWGWLVAGVSGGLGWAVLAAPLDESKVFPPMVVNMIDVGEETGSLDAMLMKVADIYDAEVEAAVEALLALMEPVMIVVLGVICGFIVISMYLPIFSLADVMSGV